jgi:hypothetical protein
MIEVNLLGVVTDAGAAGPAEAASPADAGSSGVAGVVGVRLADRPADQAWWPPAIACSPQGRTAGPVAGNGLGHLATAPAHTGRRHRRAGSGEPVPLHHWRAGTGRL